MGSAESFAVLGHEAVTNVPTSTIVGNVGVSPGSSITGFTSSPGVAVADPQVTGGLVHKTTTGPGSAAAALADAIKAYNGLAGMPFTPANDFTGAPTLGGRTLSSGVYHFDAAADLTGTLTLDAGSNNNAWWVFQIGTALTTATSSVVRVTNPGSNGGIDDGVFWQIGSDATLGTTTAFEGNILAHDSITLITGATIENGRVFALTGAVTLGQNTISPGYSGGLTYDTDGTTVVPVPLPGALLLFVSGMGSAVAFGRRFFSVS
jgi:type VI secretion system secreted protein VgrG